MANLNEADAKIKLAICVCIKNGEKTLPSFFSHLAEAVVGCENQIELVFVDHKSSDMTWNILTNIQNQPAFRPIKSIVRQFEKPGIARVRDHAWRLAKAPWVAFVDADCMVEKSWCQSTLNYIQDLERDIKIGGFGGQNFAPQSGLFYRSLGLMLNSFVGGHASSLNRLFNEPFMTEHLPTLNVCFRRQALMDAGGFDFRYERVAEDLQMSSRINAAGYQLMAVPKMKVTHLLRPNLYLWLKNMFLYGSGRIQFIRRNPETAKPMFFVPLITIILYMALALSSIMGVIGALELLRLAVMAHLLIVTLDIARLNMSLKGFSVALPVAVFITFCTHICYGFGSLLEVCSWPMQPKDSPL